MSRDEIVPWIEDINIVMKREADAMERARKKR